MCLWWILCSFLLNLCIDGGQGAPVILAVQKGEQVLPLDTAQAQRSGCYRFEGCQPLEPGQYLFVQDGKRLFNFLVSPGVPVQFSFTARLVQGRTEEVLVEGSEENRAYIRFYGFLQEQYHRLDKIVASSTDTTQILKDVARLEATTREYTAFVASRYSGTLLAILARNVFAGEEDFLENVDFTNPHYLNTSILPLRLKEYFTQHVPQQPDSLVYHVDRLLQGPMDPQVKEYCARYLFTHFFSSELMGMEQVAVHIAQRYFLEGEVTWPEEEGLREMERYVAFNRQNLLNHPAPELLLPNAQGEEIDLYGISSPYTLVVFFEDGCPVCRQEIDYLVRYYYAHTAQPLQVYAVYTQDQDSVLQRYTRELPQDWHVVWDPDFSSDFARKYNVTHTPRLFLLDAQKKIIGRMLQVSQLDELIVPVAPNLHLETETGTPYALYDTPARYSVLYFYDPGCAKCGLITHLLYQLYREQKDKGIEVIAVYTGHEANAWKRWLAEGGYTEWVNVWNPSGDQRLHNAYPLGELPVIYLLGARKNIEARELSLEALSYIVTQLIDYE